MLCFIRLEFSNQDHPGDDGQDNLAEVSDGDGEVRAVDRIIQINTSASFK